MDSRLYIPREATEGRHVIWCYYGFQIFFSLLLWLPIFYEFQRRIGLGDNEIFRIQSYYYLVFCILEIPTGYIADRFGYRKSMQWGALSLVTAHYFPIFEQTYTGFLSHFILIAAARSLISGAASAYLYEHLEQKGDRDAYKQIEGNARAWGLTAKVLCWPAVGFLMEWHFTLPYWLTMLSAIIALGFATYLPSIQPKNYRPAKVLQNAKDLRSVVASPTLMMIMLMGMGVFVIGRIVQVNLFQPILESKAFTVESYGGWMSAITVLEAMGSARPMWLRKHMTDLTAMFFLTLLIAASMPVMAYSGAVGTALGLCIFAFTSGLAYPIQRQLMNDAITDSRFRATVLSVESIVDRGLTSGIAVMAGVYLAADRMESFLVGSAIAIAAVTIVVYISLRRNAIAQKNNPLRPLPMEHSISGA